MLETLNKKINSLSYYLLEVIYWPANALSEFGKLAMEIIATVIPHHRYYVVLQFNYKITCKYNELSLCNMTVAMNFN